MTDGNTYAIYKNLDDALQEVTAELEQAEARIEELEANAMSNRVAVTRLVDGLAKTVEALEFYQSAIDLRNNCKITYLMEEAHEHARTTLAELKGQDE